MLRRHHQIRMQIHQLMDACLFAVAFWLAYVFRSDPNVMELFELQPVAPFDSFVWLYLILIPAAPLILEAQGFYNRPLLCERKETLWPLFKGSFLSALLLVFTLFFFRRAEILARSILIWFGVISFLLVLLKEEVVRALARSSLGLAQYQRRFILVGAREETTRMRAEFSERAPDGVAILAELDLGERPVGDLIKLLHEHSVNGVILTSRHSYFEQVEAAIRACEVEGVEAWLLADFFKTQISRTTFDEFYGRPVMVFRSTPDTSWQGVLKQLLDLVGAAIMLVLLAPVFIAAALAIRATSPGPIFFRQKRSGLNGAPFTIYKFRTMVSDAEQRKHELESMNEMSGPVFKVSKDPRVTEVGRFLRKFSIDELPQLYNVVRQEMSLVGPRPLPVDEVKRFNDLAHRRRLSVKPGLTCLWQVSGRSNLSDFRDWVRLDLEYIDNWSLWLDFKILWRTVPAVLAGTGAR